MPRSLVLVINALVPGCMLALRGRPGPGTTLLAGAVICLSVVCAVGVLGEQGSPLIALVAVLAYLVLMLAASMAFWWLLDGRHADPAEMRRLHLIVAQAYLRDDAATALSAARDLTRMAPSEPGAWRLLELVATSDPSLTRRAARRAARLEAEQVP
jgi:hypothetical protein